MLSSMGTVLESANEPDMMGKALKASATVTANSDQMPLDNQVRSLSHLFSSITIGYILGKRSRYY